MDNYLGYFVYFVSLFIFANINKATMNTSAMYFFGCRLSFLFNKYLEVQFLGYRVKVSLKL